VLRSPSLEDSVTEVVTENIELATVTIDRPVEYVKTSCGARASGGPVKGIQKLSPQMTLRPDRSLNPRREATGSIAAAPPMRRLPRHLHPR
jgi:hypothetical protein